MVSGTRRPACDLWCDRRQVALLGEVPDLLCLGASARASARALAPALLPHAAAQLLPVVLLPPECVRKLCRCNSSLTGTASVFLSRAVVRARPSAARSLTGRLRHAPRNAVD